MPLSLSHGRSSSDVQESAQYLVQDVLVKAVLEGLLVKASFAEGVKTHIALINLTPYDGMVEKVARKWQCEDFTFGCLTATSKLILSQYVEKRMAVELLEARPFLFIGPPLATQHDALRSGKRVPTSSARFGRTSPTHHQRVTQSWT